MSLATNPSVLLYDRDCGLCTAAARVVQFLDRRSRLRIRTLQESADLLTSVPPAEILDVARFVAQDGRLLSGADVLPAVAASLTGAPELEMLLQASPTTRSAMHRAYATFVKLRGSLICRVVPSS